MASAAQVVEQLTQAEQAAAAPYVHILFGLSKDWCAGGLRVGCMYTKSPAVLGVLKNTGYFALVSSLTSRLVANMLADDNFVAEFLTQMRDRLAASYNALTGALREMEIPHTPASAGIFVWVDLRSFLPEATWEGERALWEALIEDCGLLVTPGKACHAASPGFFRFCYAAVPLGAVGEAAQRLRMFKSKKSCS
eukprot:jgi/Botrbrau1/10962/Bobra.0383s0016.1